MDDVVRIVDLLSERTKEFSDLYTKLEGELAQALGAEGGLKDEYANSAATIKALKEERKVLNQERTDLRRKSYKVGTFEKLDWAEYQVIVSKLGLTDEAVEQLNSAATVQFDETQQAIIDNEIAPYFTADKINSKMYVEVKAQRANKNDRITEIDARLSRIGLDIDDMSLEQTDKLKANLNNASQERKDKLAEISVQFKDNKKFLEQFGDQVNSNVLYLDSEIENKRLLISRLEKNDLAVEQKERAEKDLENLEKYRKFYKDVLQDNLIEKYKKLFGDSKKVTGERIAEINDQMQILFDVLENANKEDIDDLIEKVENIANKIGKIEYTVDLTPGEEVVKVTNKAGVPYTFDESKLAYFQSQSTLFKVNYEVDGVKYTKVVDYNGLMDLYNLNLGKDLNNTQAAPSNDDVNKDDGLGGISGVDFDQIDQMNMQRQAQADGTDLTNNDTNDNTNDNTNNNTNDNTVAAPVVNAKMLKILKARKSKIADKSVAENVAAGLAIGGGLLAQIGAMTPLLASTPIGISIAIGAAVVYNREKIINVFTKAAERMKVRKIEKQLKKICKEFNNSVAGRNQHEIAVRYDLNDHIAQIVRNTTGEMNINEWTPITGDDAVAIVNDRGQSLQDVIDEVFNTNIPTRSFVNDRGEVETIERDLVRAENITAAFQLYGGVMNVGESFDDDYKAEELAAAYSKAVGDQTPQIVDASTDDLAVGDQTPNTPNDDAVVNDQIPDVSQSTNLNEIATVLQQLNPNAEIRINTIGTDPLANSRFFSSIPGDQLVLPEGFEYNEKNGVTNKHHTQSGAYITMNVEDIANANENSIKPNYDWDLAKKVDAQIEADMQAAAVANTQVVEPAAAPVQEAPAVEETTVEPAAPAQEAQAEMTEEELAENVAKVLDEQPPVLEGVKFPQPMNPQPETPVVAEKEELTVETATKVARKIKSNPAVADKLTNVIKAGEYTVNPEITVIGQDTIQPSQSGNVITPENAQELKTEFVSDEVSEELDFKEAFEDVLLEAGLENSDQIYDLDDEQYRHLIDTAETLLSRESNKIPVVLTMIEQFRKDKSVANDPQLRM